jgi:RNA polymerase sigma-70 factor (ECF subfamily)
MENGMPDPRKLFEALVREHAAMLTVYLRSALGNTSDVDDIFQETLIVAWRRLDDFDQTRSFGPWLRGIAKRLVLAHSRKQGLVVCNTVVLDRVDARLGQLAARQGDTWQEKLDVLQACVDSLPEHYRAVVSQRYLQQRAVLQVSEALKLSTAAVKKRLQRARSLVLDCMEKKLTPAECSS